MSKSVVKKINISTPNYDAFLSMFRILYKNDGERKRVSELTEDYIRETLVKISNTLDSPLDSSERDEAMKLIESNYQVFQEEGKVIEDNYFQKDWFSNVKSHYYWNRYRNYLENKIPPKVLDNLSDNVMPKLTNLLGNPNEVGSFSRRGLVIGDVQSGKTANYIGLICNAVDSGFRVIVLLTGTMEDLRKQTQIRVEEGFVGFDTIGQKNVGVGKDMKNTSIPMMFTNRENDFVKNSGKTTALSSIGKGDNTYVFVIKKNTTVLRKIYDCLFYGPASSGNKKIDAPLLMIDDEADNASINTHGEDVNPTKTNEFIRKILSLFEKASYVGYTATPFANIFIQPNNTKEMKEEDLFPKDYIYSLSPSSDYIGPDKMFLHPNNAIQLIDDADPLLLDPKHKKDTIIHKLFPSCYNSIICFLLVNTIRDLRGDSSTNRTMVINMSRYTSIQMEIEELVSDFLNGLKASVANHICQPYDEYILNPDLKAIHDVWVQQFEHKQEFSWDQIAPKIYYSISNITVKVINSKSKDKLDYEKYKSNGLRAIIVGGQSLSRGLTLDGLAVTYFFRITSTYDVLMQMGRWFGYRKNYADLCRIWMLPKTKEWYTEITKSVDQLKKDVDNMVKNKMKPVDFGIRVRNDSDDLGITAPNKMRGTIERIDNPFYYGNVVEAPFITTSVEKNLANLKALSLLGLDRTHFFKTRSGNPYFKNIDIRHLNEFLEKLYIPSANLSFNTLNIREFINNVKDMDNRLGSFDVAFVKGEGQDYYKIPEIEGLAIKPVKRKFDIVEYQATGDLLIRSNAQRRRLGGPGDTSIGLDKKIITDIMADNKAKLISAGGRNIGNKYFLGGRTNILLLVYFVQLDNGVSYEQENPEETKTIDAFKEANTYPMSFALGFPLATDEKLRDCSRYTTSKTFDYYNLFYKKEMEEQLSDADIDDSNKEKN